MHTAKFTWRFGGILVALVLNLAVHLVSASGQQPKAGASKPSVPKQWAVLIGVERYRHAPTLRYTINDVRQLARVLHERGGVPRPQIMEMTDDQEDDRFQPLRSAIATALPSWLAKIGPDDDLMLYFSGHGFRDADGQLYLGTLECDPNNAAATGVPVRWLREQLVRCQAKSKFLVIDACHAGSEKGTPPLSKASANDLTEPFRGLVGTVTMASSTGEEKSLLWDEKQHSLFTWWLMQGLKGHADEDGDGQVDIDELYKYVHRHVTRTAEHRFSRPQTPVRILRGDAPGVPVVLQLQPQSLKQVLADVAEQFAWSLEEAPQPRVGTLEFTSDSPVGELLGADFGLLGRYCASELERRLTDLGTGKFSVVDRRRIEAALQVQGFSISDLYSTQALTRLSKASGGMPILAVGTMTSRQGRVVNLRCKLVGTEGNEVFASAAGTAWLNESEWAMLGRSARVRLEDRVPAFHGEFVSVQEQVIRKLDERSNGPHPMLDPQFPFPLRVVVDGNEREPVFQGNNCFIPVRRGETYSIQVENRSGQVVFMRLLVDGLSTLPQKVVEKGIETELWGHPAKLDESRGHILDPNDPRLLSGRPLWQLSGFVTKTGAQGKVRKFEVVEASRSLASRQNFTENVGMITAAFYSPAGAVRGGLGTAAGREIDRVVGERRDVQAGNLLEVVHLRYVDADSLGATGH